MVCEAVIARTYTASKSAYGSPRRWPCAWYAAQRGCTAWLRNLPHAVPCVGVSPSSTPILLLLPCIGYLAHPFVKEALWAFIAASFSLSGGTQP